MLAAIRTALDAERDALKAGCEARPVDDLALAAVQIAADVQRPSLRQVINATGVVLHTGLGRAVLCPSARAAVAAVALGHSSLEIDLETGQRGSRRSHVETLLCELSGAEAAMAVNNNAGAVLLAVAALAAGGEVIISRGELVEIGGAFRMPDVIRGGGAKLVEVGTTNRTRLRDFAAAITDETKMILRCHPSNFAIIGFTEETPPAELAALGREKGIAVVDDLGSGAAILPMDAAAGKVLTLREAIAAGSDLVTASGDKLLGGPQAGLILGRKDLVASLARHPLARALRCDKLTLAALEATLREYRDPDAAARNIPTLRYLRRTESEIYKMAYRLAATLRKRCKVNATISVRGCESEVGGGSLPDVRLKSFSVMLEPRTGISAGELASRMRTATDSVLARVKGDAVWLDVRTVEPAEVPVVAKTVAAALNSQGSEGTP